MVVLKANQLPAFIPRSRVRMSVHQTWNSAERKSMKLRIAGDSPRRGRKDGVDNSARQRPVREDDVQRAGRDLIHHNVVLPPQGIHVIGGVSRFKRDADEVARRIPKLPGMVGGSA